MTVFPSRVQAAGPDYDSAAKEVRAILAELMAADTSNPPGNEARIVALGAKYLKEAGIPYEVTEFAPGRQNLVARLKGTGEKSPLLLLAHIDVVGAEGQEWSSPPHQLTETAGYLVGRGTSDDLSMAAIELETLLLFKRSGAALARDVILAWTGDEESDGKGLEFLLKNKRDSIQAGLALNEGASLYLDEKGKVYLANFQVAEKIYQDFELVARSPSGHSSEPLADNAIYRLAAALDRLGRHQFPARLLPATRAYFAARAAVEPPRLGAAMRELSRAKGDLPMEALKVLADDPSLNPFLRTTCITTLVSGGTRVNALPAEAKATVNCRILPDESAAQAQASLTEIVGDPAVEVRPIGPLADSAGPSPVEGPVPSAIGKIVGQMWPGVPVIPVMEKRATDSSFLRAAGIPAYGLLPVPISDSDRRRMHGADERIPAASLRSGMEFFHRLVLELAR